MHELAIMSGIFSTCFDEAEKAHAKIITRISVVIGERAGVETEALKFSFEALSKETIAENAVFDIEHIPCQGQCNNCQYSFNVEDIFFLQCERCGSDAKLKSGQELYVASIEIEI